MKGSPMSSANGADLPTVTSEKKLSQVIRERRATPSFTSAPVPDHDLKIILRAGMEAPSGSNLQPWRFIVLRDPEVKARAHSAAMSQQKFLEAPVVIVACGDLDGWKTDIDEMIAISGEHGANREPASVEKWRAGLVSYRGGEPGNGGGNAPDWSVWTNRQVMIAFTQMMLMAEALGYDTAPMEGFWEDKMKSVLKLPDSYRVVAMLAIGRLKGEDKRYSGRRPWNRTVFENEYGNVLELEE